ncbi:MAG: AmmeMemoRadiSam system protein A [Polyangiaceae bacterium]
MTRELDRAQGELLLGIARNAIAARLELPHESMEPPDEAWLEAPAATFVTIRIGGRLHGCVGNVEPIRGLRESVAHNAILAAFDDPRSRPLREDELGRANLEVSVLDEPRPVPGATEQEVLANLRPGVDGVIISRDRRRGVFLPQVWESLPDPVEFFDALKEKAGLPRRGPLPHVERFSVQKFAEAD